jgi:hypothetical protein
MISSISNWVSKGKMHRKTTTQQSSQIQQVVKNHLVVMAVVLKWIKWVNIMGDRLQMWIWIYLKINHGVNLVLTLPIISTSDSTKYLGKFTAQNKKICGTKR